MNRRRFGALAVTAGLTSFIAQAETLPPRALAGFHKTLDDLRGGKRDVVTVLHIGDSHVAADFTTGRLRQGLQARYGNAGRGLFQVPAYRYFHMLGASARLIGQWQTFNSRSDEFGFYGLSGVAARTTEAKSSFFVSSPGSSSIAFHLLKQPDGGVAVLSGKRGHTEVDTQGQPELFAVPLSGASVSMRLKSSGSVTVLGAEAIGSSRGVRVVSIGILGATGTLPERWNAALVKAQLERLDPQLIIWAFGVNEGFDKEFDIAAYAASVKSQINSFANSAPQASWVIAGPSDAQRNGGPGSACQGGWVRPPHLSLVRDTLRKIAEERAAAFWDWAQVMGGPCSMARWVDRGLGRPDHVHFTESGYQKLGDNLLSFILKRA